METGQLKTSAAFTFLTVLLLSVYGRERRFGNMHDNYQAQKGKLGTINNV